MPVILARIPFFVKNQQENQEHWCIAIVIPKAREMKQSSENGGMKLIQKRRRARHDILAVRL